MYTTSFPSRLTTQHPRLIFPVGIYYCFSLCFSRQPPVKTHTMNFKVGPNPDFADKLFPELHRNKKFSHGADNSSPPNGDTGNAFFITREHAGEFSFLPGNASDLVSVIAPARPKLFIRRCLRGYGLI